MQIPKLKGWQSRDNTRNAGRPQIKATPRGRSGCRGKKGGRSARPENQNPLRNTADMDSSRGSLRQSLRSIVVGFIWVVFLGPEFDLIKVISESSGVTNSMVKGQEQEYMGGDKVGKAAGLQQIASLSSLCSNNSCYAIYT